MNREELDAAIISMEADWKIYHRDPENNHMPNMVQLTKLRIERRKYD